MSPSHSEISKWGWGFNTLPGVIDQVISVFVPGLSGLYMHRRINSPGMGNWPPRGALALCMIPSQKAIGQRGWGFHPVRSGFDLGVTVFVPGFSKWLRYSKGFMIRGWEPILSGVRWLYVRFLANQRWAMRG